MGETGVAGCADSRRGTGLPDDLTDISRLVDHLERHGPQLISGSHPARRLADRLELLTNLDLAAQPWAALVTAAALHDHAPTDDRVDGLIDAAERAFTGRTDARGLGYVAFVRGSRALGRGRLLEATEWWGQAREHLSGGVPTDDALVATLGLEAYQDGRLPEAVACAEEALALARLRNNPRQETSAAVYLAFFLLNTGRLGRAAQVLTAAEAVSGSLLDSADWADVPLLEAARGFLEALRGNQVAADSAFARGLEVAEDLGLAWQRAITLAGRAEVTAAWDPERAVNDARIALDLLDARDETWWRSWAVRSLAVAVTEQGDTTEALVYLDRLLGATLPAPERARTLLAAGHAHLSAGDLPSACRRLLEADSLYGEIGCDYWQARVRATLAQADPAHGATWHKRVRDLSDGDPAYDFLLAGRSQLAIRLLGQPEIEVDGTPCRFDTHNAELAVYAIALAPHASLHAEALTERLWPDSPPERQSARLRTLLWQIRRALTHRHAWRLSSEQRVIHLDLTGVTVDVHDWTGAARTLLRSEVALDRQGRPLTAGDVIDGLTQPLLPAYQYEEWVAEHQATLRQLAGRLTV